MVDVTGNKFEAYPWTKHFSLDGKVALLIGAGSGLCREAAKGFAMSGAACVLFDMNLDTVKDLAEELTAAGLTAEPYEGNVTKSEDVKGVVEYIAGKYGHLDIMLNAAGITRRAPIEELDEAAFDEVINVNLKGTFIAMKYAGGQMLKQENGGSIINFGSLGSKVAIPGSSAYCASKGGVAMITKTAAVEWAPRKVRVNAVAPGTYTTPLLQYCIDHDPAYGETLLRRFPIGRFGDPEELVGALIYLASDASTYTTGVVLSVDGGCVAF